MKNALLLTQNETPFLQENRQDPITGDKFKLGDKVVFCADCKSAFLKESWEYMGNKHCNQRGSLTQIPKSNNIEIRKNKQTYHIPYPDDIFLCWTTDTIVWVIINFLFFIWLKNQIENTFFYCKIAALLTFLLKDNTLIFTSLGKKMMGITIINIKKYQKIKPFLLPLRNLIAVFTLFLFLFRESLAIDFRIIILFFCICGIDFMLQIHKKRKIVDYIFGTAIRRTGKRIDSTITIPFQVREPFSPSDYDDPQFLDDF